MQLVGRAFIELKLKTLVFQMDYFTESVTDSSKISNFCFCEKKFSAGHNIVIYTNYSPVEKYDHAHWDAKVAGKDEQNETLSPPVFSQIVDGASYQESLCN